MHLKGDPLYISMLPTVMIIVIVFFWFMIMNQQGGGGKSHVLWKEQGKTQRQDPKLTFKDVAGLDEEKEELQMVIF